MVERARILINQSINECFKTRTQYSGTYQKLQILQLRRQSFSIISLCMIRYRNNQKCPPIELKVLEILMFAIERGCQIVDYLTAREALRTE